MSFHMSDGMDTLFRRIKNHSTTGKVDAMDVYYYCMLVGMSRRKLDFGKTIRTQEFIKEFTNPYKTIKNEIIAALVASEIQRTGQSFTSDNILEMFKKYIDLNSPTKLNSEGESLLDRYAEGGFKELIQYNENIVEKIDLIITCKKLCDNIDDESDLC